MKKLALSILLLAGLCTVTLAAPPKTSDAPVRTMLKFNPILLPAGEFNMSVEQSIMRNLSIEVAGGFIFTDYWEEVNNNSDLSFNDYKGPWISDHRYETATGWTFRGGVKYYIKNLNNKGAAQGFYMEPLFLLKRVYYPNESANNMYYFNDAVKTVVGGQILFGFQAISGKFVLDPYLGFGIRNKNFSGTLYDDGIVTNYSQNYFAPSFQMGLKLGVSFQ
jgi:hypothetical protein